MWKIFVVTSCILLAAMDSEGNKSSWNLLNYINSSNRIHFLISAAKRTNKRGTGSYSGSYSGAGASGGGGGSGTGSYGDYDDYGFGGYAPDFGFGFIDPYAFHQQLTQQILAQQAAQQK